MTSWTEVEVGGTGRSPGTEDRIEGILKRASERLAEDFAQEMAALDDELTEMTRERDELQDRVDELEEQIEALRLAMRKAG